jgi:hypothetical protein
MTEAVAFTQLPFDAQVPGAWPLAVLDETATSLGKCAGIKWVQVVEEVGPVMFAVGKAGDDEPVFGIQAHEGRRGIYVVGDEQHLGAAVVRFVRSLGIDPASAKNPDGSPLVGTPRAIPKRPSIVNETRQKIAERMEELRPYVEEARRLTEALAALREQPDRESRASRAAIERSAKKPPRTVKRKAATRQARRGAVEPRAVA